MWEYRPITAVDGKDALLKIATEQPDAILLDINLPDMNGMELCSKIKSESGMKEIPIIMLTGRSSDDEVAEALEKGADDYIVKPFNPIILRARLKSVLRVKQALDDIFNTAITDSLTGLYNRRYFEMISIDEYYRAERYGSNLSLVMFDIDHFKQVNDTFGHECGDRVLRNISDMFREVRRSDRVCRWGGEEFVILMPNTKASEALICAEKIRLNIENADFTHKDMPFKVTVSAGISSLFEGPVAKSEQLLSNADKALYRAKNAGRNTCVIAE
jgi:diguanylate cyclase (GGDEF)-like protein